MDKITYLAELAEGLARWVPERERQDILRYYAEYFEEAGPGREAEVVAELGDPWALSSRLAVEGGYVTWEKAASWAPRKTWRRVLLGTAVGLSVFMLVTAFGLLAFNGVRFVSNHPVLTDVAVLPVDPPEVGAVFEWAPDGAVTIVDSGYAFVDSEHIAFDSDRVTFIGNADLVEFGLIENRSVAAFSSIDVDVSLGNIQVVTGDAFTLSVCWNDAMIGYEPMWEVRDGVLRIRAGSGAKVTRAFVWDDLKELFILDQLAVDVTITVPENTALGKISVKTGLGDVLLWGVSAETVTAETNLGNVECYEARNVRRLDLNTGAGNLNLDMEKVCSGLSISLRSGTGNVEVSLGCSEKDCQYELQSGLSLVTVNGNILGSKAEHKGNMPYRLVAESGTGSVNLYFFG